MEGFTLSRDEYLALRRLIESERESEGAREQAVEARKPRKRTARDRFMSKEMKALRRKHPRMAQTAIMSKANKAWRRKK